MPRVVVDDHGVDIVGGASLFQARHRQTLETYDIKQKAACLLKKRLEKGPRWRAFHSAVARTRCAVQQTEMAFLVPPGPKPIVRFMNLGKLLRWGERMLNSLAAPPQNVLRQVASARLQEKFGRLEGLRGEIQPRAAWRQVVDASVAFVNRERIYGQAAAYRRRKLDR